MTKIIDIDFLKQKEVNEILKEGIDFQFDEILVIGIKHRNPAHPKEKIFLTSSANVDFLKTIGMLRVLENHLFENWD